MDNGLNFIKLDPPERGRKYIFANATVEFKNVTEVCVRPSGTHRLMADGKLAIVAPMATAANPHGWLAVEIDADAWTF